MGYQGTKDKVKSQLQIHHQPSWGTRRLHHLSRCQPQPLSTKPSLPATLSIISLDQTHCFHHIIHSLPFFTLMSRSLTNILTRTRIPKHPSFSLTTTTTTKTFTMATYNRNPHPDFKSVESTRPSFDNSSSFHYTQTPSPEWKYGSGANQLAVNQDKDHVCIDPYEENRPVPFNYKLLISAITPRPIAFVSTRSADGTTTNLAPFSYFNFMNHDPPLFVVGFASGLGNAKDTLKNVLETKECVINIISESFLEAANATSINAPYGVSEWDVSGLTPAYDTKEVKCARVKESVFSVEAKLDMVKEYESRKIEGKKSGTVAIFEGVRFWVREDAVNEDKNMVDPAVLKPVSRLGGITYARTNQAVELTRPDWEKDMGGQEGFDKLKSQAKN